MHNRILPLLLALALTTACDRPAVPPAPPQVPDAPDAPPEPVAAHGAPGSAPAAGAGQGGSAVEPALPEAFVVSTNEPFWNAEVASGEVVLNGPDVSDRRFTVTGVDGAPGTRAVRARDDAGRTIEVGITAGPCEDSMSGAVFPYRGTVALEGGATDSGCARPAGTAPPVPSEK